MPEGKTDGDLQPGLLTEYLTEDTGFFVRSAREFERFQSPFQAVEVHDLVVGRAAAQARRVGARRALHQHL